MIVPDLNLLIYTYDKTSPHHTAAVKWWTACLNGREAVGLPDVVVFGFMRLTTNPRVFASPMTPAEASGIIGAWMERTMVQRLVASDDHPGRVRKLLEFVGTAGNLVTDAQIAALALQEEATVHTADGDFQRFPGVRWHNPLTGISGRSRQGLR